MPPAQVLQEQLGRRVTGMDALRPMLARSLQDLQERLIYRCQAFIKDNVASYTPSADDVDFPAKLEKLAAAEQQDAAAAAAAAAAAQAGQGEIQVEGAEQADAAPAAQADPYSVWYLPLRSTLLVLSKLYRAVDPKIFSGGCCGAALLQGKQAACCVSPLITVAVLCPAVAECQGPLLMALQCPAACVLAQLLRRATLLRSTNCEMVNDKLTDEWQAHWSLCCAHLLVS